MPDITYREYEGGIPGEWKTVHVSDKQLAAAAAAYEEYSATCQVCGAQIEDGEQGCPTPEEH